MTPRILEKPVKAADEEQSSKTCIHHWIIDPPEGPVSKGVCRKCGEEKDFQNYFAYSAWEAGQTDEEGARALLDDWAM